MAVGVNGLAQQGDLFHTPGSQRLHFAGDLFDGTAHLAAAAVGDDAEGAHQVATVDDGHVAGDVRAGRRQRADAPFPVNAQPLSHHLQEWLELLGPHEHVDVGEAAGELVGLGPHHAAHESHDALGLLPLQGGHPSQVADDLVFGALPNDAGVKHDDVGIGGLLHRLHPHLLQGRAQPVGVRGVHLATDGPEIVTVHEKRLTVSGSVLSWLVHETLNTWTFNDETYGSMMAEGMGFEPMNPLLTG